MESTDQTSAFDLLFKQVSLPDLEQEVQDTEARLSRKLEEHEKVSAEVMELQEAFRHQAKIVAVLREIGMNGRNAPDGGRDAEDGSDGMTKREIAERILQAENRPLYPREVRDIAVEHGWLPNTPNAANQLSVAMNRAATKQDYLVKDSEGRYSLPRPTAVGVSLFQDGSEGGDGP
jgi:hypothetical protein